MLIAGVYPFFARNKQELFFEVEKGQYQISNRLKVTPICLDFINRCLQYDPENRIGWDEIDDHPFCNHKNYYKMLQKVSFAVAFEEGNPNIVGIPIDCTKVARPSPIKKELLKAKPSISPMSKNPETTKMLINKVELKVNSDQLGQPLSPQLVVNHGNGSLGNEELNEDFIINCYNQKLIEVDENELDDGEQRFL